MKLPTITIAVLLTLHQAPAQSETFLQALERMDLGQKVTRSSWPTGNFVYRLVGHTVSPTRWPYILFFSPGTHINSLASLQQCYATHEHFLTCQPYTVTNTDLAANDWEQYP